jgi:purine-binding chemotaxis protein CheW
MTMDAIAEEITEAGKYLVFTLGGESYGLSVAKVREIVRMMEITVVQRTAGLERAVVNLRGEIVPLVDLRPKFGIPMRKTTERTCIVIVHVTSSYGDIPLGIVVDAIEEVSFFSKGHIQPAVDFNHSMYVFGIAHAGDKVCSLIDLDRALVSEN